MMDEVVKRLPIFWIEKTADTLVAVGRRHIRVLHTFKQCLCLLDGRGLVSILTDSSLFGSVLGFALPFSLSLIVLVIHGELLYLTRL
jgi:hypothetical protein